VVIVKENREEDMKQATSRQPVVIILAGLAIIAIILAASAPLRASDFAQGSFDRSLKVSGHVELEVTTGSGSITVRSGDAGTVSVHATIRVRDDWSGGNAEEKVRKLESNPPIVQNGNSIRIGNIEDPELRRNVSISYEVITPAETTLNSKTGSGNQSIEGLRGAVEAGTGSGGLVIRNVGGELRANSGSGNIELASIGGKVRANTGSGSIRANGLAGAVVGDTRRGNVRLQQTAPGDVKVRTGSGSVEPENVHGALSVQTGSGTITVQGEQTGEWRLEAGSGTINVHLPSQAAFEVSARTRSGSISVEQPVTVQGTIGRHELRGKVRGGGALLDLRTGSGNIRID